MASDIPSSSCFASDKKMNVCYFLSLNPAPKTLTTFTNQNLNRNQNLNLPHFHPLKLPVSVALPPLRSTSAVQSAQLAPYFRHSSAVRCSAGEAAGDPQKSKDEGQSSSSGSFWSKWKMDSAEMRSRVAKLGLAAVLAYGLFDGVTYTTFFVLAFLGYEKSTGKNPAANLQALLGIVLLMWTGNNVTRPFRVAGAAALAPVIDKGLKRIQETLNLPSQILAFALVVSMVAASCLTVVGLLILSRWGK